MKRKKKQTKQTITLSGDASGQNNPTDQKL